MSWTVWIDPFYAPFWWWSGLLAWQVVRRVVTRRYAQRG